MRILVCGGRDFKDQALMYGTLYRICIERGCITEKDKFGNWLPTCTIIHGDAEGADRLADSWAIVNWCPIAVYPAKWDEHGRAAGPIRNKQMLDEGKPDLVVAFPGGSGTANMVSQAKAAGVEIMEIGI